MTEPEPNVRRRADNGPLHDLLLKACPPCVKNRKGRWVPPAAGQQGAQSIAILASLIRSNASNSGRMTPYNIHKWIKNATIPPRRAKQIVDLSGGRVSLDEFAPFIYG